MSYVDNLYTSFTYVSETTLQSKRTLEDLIKFFKARVELEETHMRGLEKLANFQVKIREGTILSAVNAMKNDYYSRAFQTKTLIDFIHSDIITYLQSQLNTQSEVMRQVNQEALKIQKVKEAYLDSTEKAKQKYLKSCVECERLSEALENQPNQQSREKIISKLVQEKETLDINLASYQSCLETYLNFRENYKDLMTSSLNHHELHEKERLDSAKDSMRKLVVYDTSYIRNIEYDLNSLAKFVEAINPISDFKMIIDDCSVIDLPELVFEQYQSNEKEERGRTLKALRTLSGDPGSVIEVYVMEFEAVFQKLHIDLDPEDFQTFNSLVKDSIGRQAWVRVLKDKAPKLRSKAFEQLKELMISVLNECERNSDSGVLVDCLKYLKYFKNRKGEILSRLLSFHSIWGQLKMWDEVIDIMVKNEIRNREVDKIFTDELGRKGIIKNIAFCQMVLAAEYMKEFKVDPVYGNEILAKNACKYELATSDIDTVVFTLDPSIRIPVASPVVQEGIPSWLVGTPKRSAPLSLQSVFKSYSSN